MTITTILIVIMSTASTSAIPVAGYATLAECKADLDDVQELYLSEWSDHSRVECVSLMRPKPRPVTPAKVLRELRGGSRYQRADPPCVTARHTTALRIMHIRKYFPNYQQGDFGMNEIEKSLSDAGLKTFRMDQTTVRNAPIWECKVGLRDGKTAVLAGGSDAPMRDAVEKEFKRITGQDADFVFSGWGAELTKTQRHVEYQEDGSFLDAMLEDILDQIKDWDGVLLGRLMQAIKDKDAALAYMAPDWGDIPDTPEQRELIKKHNADFLRKHPGLVEIEMGKDGE